MQTLQQRNPDLSIIIPVYNLEKHLQPMLDSLKAQKLDSFTVEYIFVLNNCTDASEQVIRDSGIECQILNCSIQGCGPARNAGMEVARGTYIWFMDGDDWLLSDMAVKDVLYRVISEDLKILRIRFASNLFRMNYFSMVWQYIFRRDLIADLLFPAFQPAEDDAFMEMVLAKVGLSRYTYICLPTISRPLYYYNYMREGSNMYRVSRGETI